MNNQVTESLIAELTRTGIPVLSDQDIRFIRGYYQRLSGQDYDAAKALEFRDIALFHRELGDTRSQGQITVELQNLDITSTSSRSCTVVYVIFDDIPFAIDSLLMRLNAINKTPERVIHPLFEVTRNHTHHAEVYERSGPSGEKLKQHSYIESFVHLVIEYTPALEHEAIAQEIRNTIVEIQDVVNSWQPIRDKLAECAQKLQSLATNTEFAEYDKLFEWLRENNFACLGYCEVQVNNTEEADSVKLDAASLLGNLITAHQNNINAVNRILPPVKFPENTPVVYTKTRLKAGVYRPDYMDCILFCHGQPDKNESMQVSCILGFIGRSKDSMPHSSIPHIRNKISWVLESSVLRKNGHGYKQLRSLLNSLPREKLFQMNADQLYALGMTLLNQERRKTRLHLHRNICGHFYSCLVYIPRDLFNSHLRTKIQQYLRVVMQASEVEFVVYFSHSILTRIHYIIHTDPAIPLNFNQEQLESDVQNIARDWNESLFEELKSLESYQTARDLLNLYQNSFPASYQEAFSIQDAISDIAVFESLANGEIQARLSPALYTSTDSTQQEHNACFKIYCKEITVALSDVLPILEHLGVRIHRERPYRISRKNSSQLRILDFDISRLDSKAFQFESNAKLFQETFIRCWNGDIENDGFNGLTLLAGISWQNIAMFRAYYRYLKQIRLRYSENYIIETLNRNPSLSVSIAHMFEARFGPIQDEADISTLNLQTHSLLQQVSTLDEERIITALLDVIAATLRTNFFQLDKNGSPKSYLSFKLNSRSIPRIPEPAPLYEIFVYSPRFEGVHLRGGKVARGGLRWSERPEDFRTEVLGLAKAQRVKNAVIVPVGSKGGFVVKQIPTDSQDVIQKEVINCYRMFIRGLLDITDNIVENRIVNPENVVRIDDDDPYLVVAADKGTATFSDIANDISNDYGFWLGDAFASGGSAGYDHKRMGITARGAWESVKRHFRELGKDIQSQPFTVVGIGDMSGDVFGNGMLLSHHTKVIAAFNHLHIIIDPDPDPEISYRERKRLFDLSRSSWADYDLKCLSAGGGVYSRKEKSIHLSPQAKTTLAASQDDYTPDDLINTILKANVELLWNGGIGTYVKASSESHADAQDRNNDGLRVNADELRCRVIGEGGNLGMTQLGRIEYALNGGLCYTDAIDNSAGVDTSDHEVNIKILLNTEIQNNNLPISERNSILSQMEGDVARLVLANNYRQTQIVSMEAENGALMMPRHIRAINLLEDSGLLNRTLEFLPADAELVERLGWKKYLTRPELSVLLSYCKMDFFQKLLDSNLPDDDYLGYEIEQYFPDLMNRLYKEQIHGHRLKREIIATQITNNLIGNMGTTFYLRTYELTGKSAQDICSAYIVASDFSANDTLAQKVQSLDNKVDSATQMEIFNRLCRFLESTAIWILRSFVQPIDMKSLIDRYSMPYEELCCNLDKILSAAAQKRYTRIFEHFTESGVPEDLAQEITSRDILNNGIDIVDIALKHSSSVLDAGKLYFEVANVLSIEWIYKRIALLNVNNIWHERARFSLLNDLRSHQSEIAGTILASSTGGKEDKAFSQWQKHNGQQIESLDIKVKALKQETSVDFSMLSVLVSELGTLR